jgi:hypothetical protein
LISHNQNNNLPQQHNSNTQHNMSGTAGTAGKPPLGSTKQEIADRIKDLVERRNVAERRRDEAIELSREEQPDGNSINQHGSHQNADANHNSNNHLTFPNESGAISSVPPSTGKDGLVDGLGSLNNFSRGGSAFKDAFGIKLGERFGSDFFGLSAFEESVLRDS